MRLDYSLLSRRLNDAAQSLRSDEPPHVFAARLLEFTGLIFETPLAAAALDSLLAERTQYASALERHRRSLLRLVEPELTGQYNLSVATMMYQYAVENSTRSAAVQPAKDIANSVVPWGPERKTIAEILQAATSRETVTSMSLEQLKSFRDNVLPALRSYGEALRNVEGAVSSDNIHLTNTLGRLEAILDDGLPRLQLAERLLELLELRPVIDSLREFHDEIRSAATDAFMSVDARQRCLAVLEGDGTRQNLGLQVRFVADLLLGRLSVEPLRQHIVLRLAVYLEHFAKDELLSRLAKRGKRKREDIIQDMIDAFVFAEGLLPITHSEASGGTLDVFVDQESKHLFERAAADHLPPLLIELKQMLNDGKTVSARRLRKAVDHARDQGAIYQRQVQLNPRWIDTVVYPIVVYAGPTRFRAEPNVVLIYIGPSKPWLGAQALPARDAG